MNRKIKATVPKLNNRGGDLTKDWFVYYRFFNEKSTKYEQIRIYKGFAELKSAAARVRFANNLIDEIVFKLKNGFNPIDEKEKTLIFFDEIEYSANARLGGRNKKSNKTVNYFANAYLASVAQEISSTSYTTYQSKLRIFVKYIESINMHEADISAITPKVITNFFNYLVTVRKITNSRQLYKEQVYRIFDFAIEQNAIKYNPVLHIKIKKKPAQAPRYFSEKAIARMKEYFLANDPQMWLACRLIFYCYIRPHEIRFLRVSDILITEEIIRVSAEISKTNRERMPVIPLHFKKELIEEGLINYPADYYLITTSGKPGAKGVSKNYFWNRFEKMRLALKMHREFKFYGFKHTGMVMQIKAGADSKDIQMQAGHQSLEMTDKYLKNLMPVESEHLKFYSPKI